MLGGFRGTQVSLPLLPECHRLPPSYCCCSFLCSQPPGTGCQVSLERFRLAGILFLSPSFPLSLSSNFFLADLSCLNGSDHSCPGLSAQAELLCKAPSTGNTDGLSLQTLLHFSCAQAGSSLFPAAHVCLGQFGMLGASRVLQADPDAGIALCGQCCRGSHLMPRGPGKCIGTQDSAGRWEIGTMTEGQTVIK